MKIVSKSYGKYQCPYCNTVVELQESDVRQWNTFTIITVRLAGEHRILGIRLLTIGFVLMLLEAKRQ